MLENEFERRMKDRDMRLYLQKLRDLHEDLVALNTRLMRLNNEIDEVLGSLDGNEGKKGN